MKYSRKGFVVQLVIVIAVLLMIGTGLLVYSNKRNEIPKIQTDKNVQAKYQFPQNASTSPSQQNKSVSQTPTAIPNTTISPNSAAQIDTNDQFKPNCFAYPDYYVVTRQTNSVGDDILIKYKDSYGGKYPSCVYTFEPNDYHIGGFDTAEYFSKIVDHFAITDIGTSASLRSFAVYDLTIRKQIFSGSYVDGQINITDRSVTYWTPTNITPTLQNCPQYNEWYHSAVIASEMSLSFPDIKNTDLGTKRCFYQE